MMGQKERNFRSLPEDISLEDLVAKDNFYRRLEERLDLSFVRASARRSSPTTPNGISTSVRRARSSRRRPSEPPETRSSTRPSRVPAPPAR
jgi:hypothetical protein